MNEMIAIGAGLSIGLAGFWVVIGQGILTYRAMSVMGKNPNLVTFFLTVTILWVALIESSAIYGLVVALSILWKASLTTGAAIGAGIAMGVTGMGCGMGQWILVSSALDAINRNPDNKTKMMAFMILFAALLEVIAIYGLVVSFKILG